MKNNMLKPAILSLSLITVMSGAAVAPAIAQIAAAFPDISQTAIKSILTLPAVFIIVFSLIAGRLSSRMPKRSILAAGLLFYLVGGVGGGFANSFELLLLSRAVLGIGVGLIMPLSTGLIADFFDGEERTKLIGYSTAASNLGGIIATMTAGGLAVLSWRYTFGVYGLGLIVLILVLLFLPEPETATSASTKRQKLPRVVYAWAGGAFALMIAFYAIPVNLAIFIRDNNLGDASTAGLALAVATAWGFVAGLFYGRVKLFLKSFLPVVLFGLLAFGFMLLSQAMSLPQILAATSAIGLGLGWTMPTLFIGATQAGGKGKGVQVMAVVSSMVFLGQFLSPIVLDYAGEFLGKSSERFTFSMIAFSFGTLLLVTLVRWTVAQWGNAMSWAKTQNND
jgi:MFS family permease